MSPCEDHDSSIDELAAIDPFRAEYAIALTEVTGIIGPVGQGGLHVEDAVVYTFTFAAWQKACGEIRRSDLCVMRKVPKAIDSSDELYRFPEGTVLRLCVLLSVDEKRAVLAKVIAAGLEHAGLESALEEYCQPVVVMTDRFGPLTLDRRLNWFQGVAFWLGREVTIYFAADDDLSFAPQLATAQKLFDDAASWERKVRTFAVHDKLALANDWRDEEDPPISAADFLARMTLESISFHESGRFEFWHDDGDLFAGHSISLRGSLHEGIFDCDIPG